MNSLMNPNTHRMARFLANFLGFTGCFSPFALSEGQKLGRHPSKPDTFV
jgi:hypothetical protein